MPQLSWKVTFEIQSFEYSRFFTHMDDAKDFIDFLAKNHKIYFAKLFLIT